MRLIAEWQKARGYPFALHTEASVNLVRMGKLMDAMVDAGFDTVFLGIETPNPKALIKIKKPQNTNKRDENYLFNAARRILGKGMQVQGGFILGLDGDGEGVFDAMIEFIRNQRAGCERSFGRHARVLMQGSECLAQRQPARFMGSWNSLVERVRSLSSEPRSRHDLGAEQLAFMSGMLDRAVDFRLAHPELEERWIDVNYYELVEDPMGVIGRIHEHFGWTLEQAAVDAMTDWRFRQAVHRQRETRHRYSLEDYGLTVEAVNAAFARYREFLTSRGIRSLRR